MGFKTDAIHAGQEPDPTTGAVTVPIYQTSTYVQEGLGKHKGFEYARTQNPTRMALEKNMAVLEARRCRLRIRIGHGGDNGGDAAAAEAGRSCDLFGQRLRRNVPAVRQDRAALRHRVHLREYVESVAIRKAMRPNTRMVFIETPTNPIMSITDIRARLRDCASQTDCRARRGQHVHVAVLSTADRAWRRYRRSLHDQVSQRAQRQRGRYRRLEAKGRCRTAAVHPECGGRDSVAV